MKSWIPESGKILAPNTGCFLTIFASVLVEFRTQPRTETQRKRRVASDMRKPAEAKTLRLLEKRDSSVSANLSLFSSSRFGTTPRWSCPKFCTHSLSTSTKTTMKRVCNTHSHAYTHTHPEADFSAGVGFHSSPLLKYSFKVLTLTFPPLESTDDCSL